MAMINDISSVGQWILFFQFSFFCFVLFLGVYQLHLTKHLRKLLSESLKSSKDLVGEKNKFNELAVDCRSRYSHSAESIEAVNAFSIAASELISFRVRFGPLRWTLYQSDELLNGASGFLVTLGLVGSFAGLIQNLSGMSLLLAPGSAAAGQLGLVDGFAALLPVMAAAFITSLVGILLGSFLWLLAAINGMFNLKDELLNMLCAYLEQVVHANCRVYSLVAVSMARMERYLEEYLSSFSSTVGNQIERSIDQSTRRLVSALVAQVEETTQFVKAISQGCTDLERAGEVFSKATSQLERSDFASEFSEACSSFIDHTKLLAQTTENVKAASGDLSQQAIDLAIHISRSSDIHQDLGDVLAQSARALDASQQTALSTSQRLNAAVDAMEGVNKRGMTWLSMRAKTDSKLVGLTEQLQQMLLKFSSVADKISTSTYSDLSALRADFNELKGISAALLEGARRSESEMQLVKAGLEQMADASMRLAA